MARSIRRRFAQHRRGQALLEMAFALPFLMLLMVATLDLGTMFFQYVQMRSSVGEGISGGARNPADTAGILQHV